MASKVKNLAKCWRKLHPIIVKISANPITFVFEKLDNNANQLKIMNFIVKHFLKEEPMAKALICGKHSKISDRVYTNYSIFDRKKSSIEYSKIDQKAYHKAYSYLSHVVRCCRLRRSCFRHWCQLSCEQFHFRLS